MLIRIPKRDIDVGERLRREPASRATWRAGAQRLRALAARVVPAAIPLGATALLACTATGVDPLQRSGLADAVVAFVGLRLVYEIRGLREVIWVPFWIAFPAAAIVGTYLLHGAATVTVFPPVAIARAAAYAGGALLFIACVQWSPALRARAWRLGAGAASVVRASGHAAPFAVLELAALRGEATARVPAGGFAIPVATLALVSILPWAVPRLRGSHGALAAVLAVASIVASQAWPALQVLTAGALGGVLSHAALGDEETQRRVAFGVHVLWAAIAIAGAVWALLDQVAPLLIWEPRS